MLKHYRKIFIFIFVLAIMQINGLVPLQPGEVLGATSEDLRVEESIQPPIKIETETAFDQYEDVVYESIPYPTEYVDDNEMEYGLEEVQEEGVDGVKTLVFPLPGPATTKAGPFKCFTASTCCGFSPSKKNSEFWDFGLFSVTKK